MAITGTWRNLNFHFDWHPTLFVFDPLSLWLVIDLSQNSSFLLILCPCGKYLILVGTLRSQPSFLLIYCLCGSSFTLVCTHHSAWTLAAPLFLELVFDFGWHSFLPYSLLLLITLTLTPTHPPSLFSLLFRFYTPISLPELSQSHFSSCSRF